MSCHLLWLRNDLRLHDHPIFSQPAHFLLPVYILEPRDYALLPDGFSKAGPWRLQFLLQSLRDLAAQLAARGSGLLFAIGEPQSLLPALMQQYQLQTLWTGAEVTPEEIAQQQAVAAALPPGCQLKTFWQRSLFHPDDLPGKMGSQPERLPQVFSPFRRQIETSGARWRAPLPVPEQLPRIPGELRISGVEADGRLPGSDPWPELTELGLQAPIPDARSAVPFSGGENAALARLQHYLWTSHGIACYKETRNSTIGPDYSSKFSLWLANGSLSPRQIMAEVKRYEAEYGANDSTYWLYIELLWRDYFFWLARQHGPRLFWARGLKDQPPLSQPDADLLQRWRDGQTADNFINAGMRELQATGYLSNRLRQNVASYLVHHLKQDWRAGARWFEHCLIDYDPCSNWGNWLYLAGVGTDPRTRVFNPRKQAQNYDPSGDYRRLWG
ncbi:MAG: DASH family cryptochrome [Candidatus Sericytochromatia bacterium]|nr:DASH family cryptochrome [Candidatus Sericytochromatia bacterium]